jgi:hypothetical protein
MHWPVDRARRRADRDEREALERYLRLRTVICAKPWLDAVGEASRRADATLRLERRLERMG